MGAVAASAEVTNAAGRGAVACIRMVMSDAAGWGERSGAGDGRRRGGGADAGGPGECGWGGGADVPGGAGGLEGILTGCGPACGSGAGRWICLSAPFPPADAPALPAASANPPGGGADHGRVSGAPDPFGATDPSGCAGTGRGWGLGRGAGGTSPAGGGICCVVTASPPSRATHRRAHAIRNGCCGVIRGEASPTTRGHEPRTVSHTGRLMAFGRAGPHRRSLSGSPQYSSGPGS